MILRDRHLFARATEVASFEHDHSIGSSTNTGWETFILETNLIRSRRNKPYGHRIPLSTLHLNTSSHPGGSEANAPPPAPHTLRWTLPICGLRLLRWQGMVATRRFLFTPPHSLPRLSVIRACTDTPPCEGTPNTLFCRCYLTHRGHHRMEASLPDSPVPCRKPLHRSSEAAMHEPGVRSRLGNRVASTPPLDA